MNKNGKKGKIEIASKYTFLWKFDDFPIIYYIFSKKPEVFIHFGFFEVWISFKNISTGSSR